MNIWIYIIISTSIVSLTSLTGIFFILANKKVLSGIVDYLVSFAVGGLFGGAFFHLIPEALEHFEGTSTGSLIIIIGILLFFILEKFLHWRHNHTKSFTDSTVKVHGPINIIADAFHNFIDGVLIAASFQISIELGIATSLAVLIHEIPQEIGDFGVLIHSGYSTKKALLYNLLSALSAFAGVLLVLILGQGAQSFSNYIIPLAAGGFIYLAGSDLIPELHNEHSFKKTSVQLITMIIGLSILYSLTFLEN